MMHFLHQGAVLGQRRLQLDLPLAHVLGHGVERVRDAPEFDRHSRIDRGGRGAVRIAASLARGGFDALDPPHHVALDGAGVGEAEKGEERKGRETDRDEPSPRVEEPLFVEPHQNRKMRPEGRRQHEGAETPVSVASDPALPPGGGGNGLRQPGARAPRDRLRNHRAVVCDQGQMGLAERVARVQARTDGVRPEHEHAARLRPGRRGRAGGCNPEPVVDDGQAKIRARVRDRRVRRKLREVKGLAGGAGPAGRVDEADRRIIGVATNEGLGQFACMGRR